MTVAPLYEFRDDLVDTGAVAPVVAWRPGDAPSSGPACALAGARLYAADDAGVARVFVDHPALRVGPGADIYAAGPNSTYATPGDAAAFPDLDVRYSILCQAAVAAPLLLWGVGGWGGAGEAAVAGSARAAADGLLAEAGADGSLWTPTTTTTPADEAGGGDSGSRRGRRRSRELAWAGGRAAVSEPGARETAFDRAAAQEASRPPVMSPSRERREAARRAAGDARTAAARAANARPPRAPRSTVDGGGVTAAATSSTAGQQPSSLERAAASSAPAAAPAPARAASAPPPDRSPSKPTAGELLPPPVRSLVDRGGARLEPVEGAATAAVPVAATAAPAADAATTAALAANAAATAAPVAFIVTTAAPAVGADATTAPAADAAATAAPVASAPLLPARATVVVMVDDSDPSAGATTVPPPIEAATRPAARRAVPPRVGATPADAAAAVAALDASLRDPAAAVARIQAARAAVTPADAADAVEALGAALAAGDAEMADEAPAEADSEMVEAALAAAADAVPPAARADLPPTPFLVPPADPPTRPTLLPLTSLSLRRGSSLPNVALPTPTDADGRRLVVRTRVGQDLPEPEAVDASDTVAMDDDEGDDDPPTPSGRVVAAAALLTRPPLFPADAGPRPVAFVGNDWPCGPLAAYIREAAAGAGPGGRRRGVGRAYGAALASSLVGARTAFCIHNLAYQGVFDGGAAARLCLPPEAIAPLEEGHEAADGDASPTSPRLNWMRGALATADAVVTVSPTYALEITTDPASACGLLPILASRGVAGIVNGLDTVEWDPAADALLPAAARFDAATAAAGKAAAKASFQARHGLALDPDACLVGYIGRLTDQKGVDVLLAAAPALVGRAHVGARPPKRLAPLGSLEERVDTALDGADATTPRIQLVALGTGEPWMQAALASLAPAFPGAAAGVAAFSEAAAHLLAAAADVLLVPSRFEPCGLVARAAARYGALPVVAPVGGLADLVAAGGAVAMAPVGAPGDAGARRAAVASLVAAVRSLAARRAADPAAHAAAVVAAMGVDVGWDGDAGPAAEWEAALRDMLER